jgi:hypothetical protein
MKAKLFGFMVDRQQVQVEHTLRKPSADENAPAEMSLEDWQAKYGGSRVPASPTAERQIDRARALTGMNIQIVKPQPGPQAAFIQCTADVVCYGGAAAAASHGPSRWTSGCTRTAWRRCPGPHPAQDPRGPEGFHRHRRAHVCRECAIFGEGELLQVHERGETYCGYLEREADAANYQGWSLTGFISTS